MKALAKENASSRTRLGASTEEESQLLTVPGSQMLQTDAERMQKLALGSIAIGFVVLGLKAFAYRITGSIALYSDAVESIVNVVTAMIALYAVRVSQRPADDEHPYGHHKAEYFSAVLEGVLIILAALAILREAYEGFMTPRLIDAPWQGLLVNGLASCLNAGWAMVLIRQGRAMRSPALVADGRHLMTDVVTSLGVIVGLIGAVVTGWARLDAVLAALVAVGILWSGWGLMRESVGGLMDRAVSPEELAAIRAVIARHAEGAIEAHDLRTRHAGRATFIDFHLVVPGDMGVSHAHSICDEIEQALRALVADAQITIHVEPEEKAKHRGIVVL